MNYGIALNRKTFLYGTKVAVLTAAIVLSLFVSSGNATTLMRVTGSWSLAQQGFYNETFQWTITPQCATGPCTFDVQSSSGNSASYKLDSATGQYTRTRSGYLSCLKKNGRVVKKKAYKFRDTIILTPTAGVLTEYGETEAISMDYKFTQVLKRTKAAKKRGCRNEKTRYTGGIVDRNDIPDGPSVSP